MAESTFPAKAANIRKLALAALAMSLTGCATLPPEAGAGDALALTPCPIEGVAGEVMCGNLQVLENRKAASGRKISLKVVVLRRLGQIGMPNPLFTFAGGPGQGESGDAKDNAHRFAEIRRDRDIVMVDQRGTGGSNPLNCKLGDSATLVRAFLAGDLPIEQVRTCRDQLSQKADLRFYATAIAMEDLDEVRRRLGYDKINLYGGSYGSRAALVYMARYPARVRTATLRAVFPPSLRNPLASPRDAQGALDRLFQDCAADAACKAAYPNLAADFAAALDELSARPATVSVGGEEGSGPQIEISRAVFAGAIRRLLYSVRSQALVPGIIERAKSRDFTMLQPVLAQMSGIERSLSMGMFLSVTCTEDVAHIRERDIQPATAGTFNGDVMVRSLVKACRHWPSGTPSSGRDPRIRGLAPVLLLSGALDP